MLHRATKWAVREGGQREGVTSGPPWDAAWARGAGTGAVSPLIMAVLLIGNVLLGGRNSEGRMFFWVVTGFLEKRTTCFGPSETPWG